jgi:hypothetical protein
METWVWYIVAIAIAWALNAILREYLTAKMTRQIYQRNLRKVITDPNSQVKGRFG